MVFLRMKNFYFKISMISKEIIISLITGFFIYYRKLDYYKTIPRYDLVASFGIIVWTYLSIIEPWFIIIGLVVLNIFGFKKKMN